MRQTLCGIVLTLFLLGALVVASALNPAKAASIPRVAGKGPVYHSADQDQDNKISLTELLRVIQFFNLRGFHCQEGTEDGFTPGAGTPTDCTPHASDYNTQNWQISLTELLRLIQFFNLRSYYACAESEDGFCPGTPANVVVVLLDALRADRLGTTRNSIPVTPFLLEFAQGGANFTHAVSPCSWTRPSIAAYFTGMYPENLLGGDTTQLQDQYTIDDSWETIGEWMVDRGYDPWVLLNNSNVSADLGFAQGFPEGRYEFIGDFLPAEMVTDAALGHLNDWKEPFFSYIHYVDPHGPYAPPSEYDDVFGTPPVITASDEYNISAAHFRDFVRDLSDVWANHVAPTFTPLTANGIKALRYRYDAETRYLDDQLSRLLPAIQQKYPNTIFVILSDHGETLMGRGMIGHSYALYEDLIRVPLIVRGPGITAATIDYTVETLGLLPTLAKLLNLIPNPLWQGKDFFTDHSSEPTFSHTWCSTAGVFTKAQSVTLGNMKLIDHNVIGAPQLFDLATDPNELTDIAAQQPETFTQLTEILNQHLELVMHIK